MKKLTALMLALMLALAMVPTVALADPLPTFDVSSISTYQVDSNASYFKDHIITNTTNRGGGFYRIQIQAIEGTVIENVTFDTGVGINIFALAGANQDAHVTLKNCTFNGTLSAKYEYAVTVFGGKVTFENCTFNRVYRAINMNHSAGNGATSALSVTGCTFDLETITDPINVTRNIGIQLANNPAGDAPHGWKAGNVNISGNTFKNCYTALRLHEDLVLHTDFPANGTLAVFNTNLLINCLSGVAPDNDANAAKKAILNGIIANNVTETGTNTGTVVTAGVDPTFTITIPAAVDFGKVAKGTGDEVRDFVVSASGVVIEPDKKIKVSVTSDFKLSGGGADLVYRLWNGAKELITGEEYASFIADGNHAGELRLAREQIAVAAAYQDTMVFTIAYVNKP